MKKNKKEELSEDRKKYLKKIKLRKIEILVTQIFILIAFIAFSVSVLGATGIVLFGDVIVCIVFIVMLIKFIIKRRKK